MLAATHIITSAAVGTATQSIPAAFSISFLLHFLLDTFKHWNFFYEKHRPFTLWAALDFAIGVLITLLFIGRQLWTPSVLAAISGGLSPDVPSFLSYLLRTRKNAFHKFHHRIQYETNSIGRGIISQILAIAIALITFKLSF